MDSKIILKALPSRSVGVPPTNHPPSAPTLPRSGSRNGFRTLRGCHVTPPSKFFQNSATFRSPVSSPLRAPVRVLLPARRRCAPAFWVRSAIRPYLGFPFAAIFRHSRAQKPIKTSRLPSNDLRSQAGRLRYIQKSKSKLLLVSRHKKTRCRFCEGTSLPSWGYSPPLGSAEPIRKTPPNSTVTAAHGAIPAFCRRWASF
jgi:hypothetical protein